MADRQLEALYWISHKHAHGLAISRASASRLKHAAPQKKETTHVILSPSSAARRLCLVAGGAGRRRAPF